MRPRVDNFLLFQGEDYGGERKKLDFITTHIQKTIYDKQQISIYIYT